ncbi:MAG TPA: penicillin-binding protein activator [Telluria sp.]
MLIKNLKALGVGLAAVLISGCTTVSLDEPQRLCAPGETMTSTGVCIAEVNPAGPPPAPAPVPRPAPEAPPAAPVQTSPIDLYGEAPQAAPATPVTPVTPAAPGAPALAPEQAPGLAPAPAPTLAPAGTVRIALLLPLRSPSLGGAAESVRAGFMASVDRDGAGFQTDVVSTGDDPAATLDAYTRAAATHDIVVGPLARPAVDALVASGQVTRPTILLNHPEQATQLPTLMLEAGLSLEDEARQVADWAAREHPQGRALILAGNSAWAPRVVAAFEARWNELGHTSQRINLPSSEGRVDPSTVAMLRSRLDSDAPDLLFSALDLPELRQVRAQTGATIPLYGGGPSNPGPGAGMGRAVLDGLRLVDLPWLIQPDNPTVMVYPRPTDADQPLYMSRLYALGIDAFLVAHELAQHPGSAFNIDGVTGRLSVDDAAQRPRLQRREATAVYHDGNFDPVVQDR